MNPNRKYIAMTCKKCGKEMMIRSDYYNKHSGVCMSCQKKGNSNAKKHGDYKERLYHIWVGMKYRRYKNYNPKVFEDWSDYSKFKEWALANGYRDNLTIDRIDSHGDYCPSNCQWITIEENAGKDKRIFNPKQKKEIFKLRIDLNVTQVEMAKLLGVSRNTIQRLERDVKNEKFL